MASSRPAPLPARTPAAATVDAFVATLSEPVASGVTRRHGRWLTTDGWQVAELIEVDPSAPGIGLETSVPVGGVDGLETVLGQAGRRSRDGHRVVAAINGDVWQTDPASHTKAPNGLQVQDGELVTGSSRVRPTLGFDPTGSPRLGDVAVAISMTLPDGTALAIDRFNKPRRSGDIVLYSRRWSSSTETLEGGVEVVLAGAALPIRASGTWTATVASVRRSGGDTAIAAGSLVLSADGSKEAALSRLAPGATVSVTTSITAGWEDVVEAIGGREWLVEDGHVGVRPVSDVTIDAHPRTAVGIGADGQLIMATVDGRQRRHSIGVVATDLADLLLDQGVTDAIMLDGGGSTTALVRRPGDVEATLVNRPSDGQERKVASALLVVSSTPTGPLDGPIVRPFDALAVVGESVAFEVGGVDKALNGVDLPGTPATWSTTGAGGTLHSGGLYRAREAGTATISAQVGSETASASVTVVPDTFPPIVVPPETHIRRGAQVDAGAIPVNVSWVAATDIGTGLDHYELQQRLDGGTWTDVPLPDPTARSLDVRLPPGRAVQYQLRAVDEAGNASAWVTDDAFHLRLPSERSPDVRYDGRWRTSQSSAYLGGAVRWARSSRAKATFTFTGREIAWIAARGPNRGTARISIDGEVVGKVNLHSSLSRPRRAVFTYAWNKPGRHRITIRVLGTDGHPRVDVDGFAIVDGASPDPVLVGAGDVATCARTADSATAALLDRIPGTVFVAGDTVYDAGTAAEFAQCYAPTWGPFRARTRPVPGNHDYGSAGAAPYFAYFGSLAGSPGQGWYAYDLGTWRIYSLNSNCGFVGGCHAGSAQETWLRADLAANPRVCVAAVWHHPLFSSGAHGNDLRTRALWAALQDAGAEFVLNGHDHDYERFAPQSSDGMADAATGIREFVVGTGGAGLRAFANARANSEVRRTGVHGVLKVELRAAGYRWSFVPVAGSTWTDGGSADCH